MKKDKKELPEGFVSTGKKVDPINFIEIDLDDEQEDKEHFPCLYLCNSTAIECLDNEGYAIIKYKKVEENKAITKIVDSNKKKTTQKLRHNADFQITCIKPIDLKDFNNNKKKVDMKKLKSSASDALKDFLDED